MRSSQRTAFRSTTALSLLVAAGLMVLPLSKPHAQEGGSATAGMKLPLGASGQVVKAARQLVAQHGEQMLPKVAKMHFKTTQNVLK